MTPHNLGASSKNITLFYNTPPPRQIIPYISLHSSVYSLSPFYDYAIKIRHCNDVTNTVLHKGRYKQEAVIISARDTFTSSKFKLLQLTILFCSISLRSISFNNFFFGRTPPWHTHVYRLHAVDDSVLGKSFLMAIGDFKPVWRRPAGRT